MSKKKKVRFSDNVEVLHENNFKIISLTEIQISKSVIHRIYNLWKRIKKSVQYLFWYFLLLYITYVNVRKVYH